MRVAIFSGHDLWLAGTYLIWRNFAPLRHGYEGIQESSNSAVDPDQEEDVLLLALNMNADEDIEFLPSAESSDSSSPDSPVSGEDDSNFESTLLPQLTLNQGDPSIITEVNQLIALLRQTRLQTSVSQPSLSSSSSSSSLSSSSLPPSYSFPFLHLSDHDQVTQEENYITNPLALRQFANQLKVPFINPNSLVTKYSRFLIPIDTFHLFQFLGVPDL